MGVVYKAEDLRLGRLVALKFLPEAIARDPEKLERFRREAWTAASLDHPHICTVHDLGKHEGQLFIVMQFLDGQTLSRRIDKRPLETDELLRLAAQVADALEAAHGKGIIHRDIKPSNIFITQRGNAKVLDFGVAKLVEAPGQAQDLLPTVFLAEELTDPGATVGTTFYMSPEQALGKELDARSDLFSLGVVLYEMGTGALPFQGDTSAAVYNQILNKTPISPVRLNPELSDELTRIINKALEKDPALRYQTASDFKADLQRLRRDTGSSRTAVEPTAAVTVARKGLWRYVPVAATACLLLAAAAIYFLVGWSGEQIGSLAVLPLENAGRNPEIEYLSDGISGSIIYSLSQLPSLRVIPSSTLERYRGKKVNPSQVGRELNVRAVLAGSLMQRGDSLLVRVELIDTEEDRLLWGRQYNRKMSDILELQDEIAREISQSLQLELTSDEQKQLSRQQTEDPQAYQAYLRGIYFRNQETPESIRKAIEQFQQAIAIDPTFAVAYANLADCFFLAGGILRSLPFEECKRRARQAAEQALKLDPNLSEAHVSNGLMHEFYDLDWTQAEKRFKRAIELSPRHWNARREYGLYLLRMGRFEEAVIQMEVAQQADPLSRLGNFHLAIAYLFVRQYDRAIEQHKKLTELHPDYTPTHLGWAYLKSGKPQEAIGVFERTAEREMTGLTHACSTAGNRPRAEQLKGALQKRLVELLQQDPAPGREIAEIYTGLGNYEEAFRWLERWIDDAYENREPSIPNLRFSSNLFPLQSDARFDRLLRRLGL